ncbi:hypothetical protein ACH5RR_010729 [Cinchona calisaya]|uniref:Uncharacterized protein n=1 Tax=Cinchona calisaya TaxID=153742 RepID=A0ABD3AJQ5_9GENT
MDRRNYVDISSCMLFEATGDSEADFDTSVNIDNMGASSEDTAGLAEDDAFSCSCENECNDFDHRTEDYVYFGDHDEEEKKESVHEYEEEEEDDDEDEDETVNQVLRTNDHNYMAGVKILKRNIDHQALNEEFIEEGSRKKLKVCRSGFMSERDKDRHFWETCLAS